MKCRSRNMAEDTESERINHVPSTGRMPRLSIGNDTRQPIGLFMTHTGSLPETASPTILTRGMSFGARTAEQTRVFANNISSAIESIEPLIEQAGLRSSVSLGSLLNMQRGQTQTRIQSPVTENAIPRVPSDSYAINLDDHSASELTFHNEPIQDHHHHQMTITNNPLNVILQPEEDSGRNQSNAINSPTASIASTASSSSSGHNNNNSNANENSTDSPQIRPEVAETVLKVYKRYIPFVLILIAKAMYDHRVVLLNLIVILFTFDYANTVLQREVAKQQNKSWMSLLVTMCYVIACIVCINFEFDIHIFPSYNIQPVTIGELLWSVFVTDYILKLITIVIKIAFTCLPTRVVEIRKRAKYYFMVEATSQLYRAMMPVRPWLHYLLEAYQGTEKVVGIFLFVVYTISKGYDFLSNVELFYKAVGKLFQDVILGVSPSKEVIIESGGICAICHSEYSMPVQLKCTHIFCEICILTWLNRERSCPMCRSTITDHPSYGDGQTTNFVQFY